jgi:hypothetical protein
MKKNEVNVTLIMKEIEEKQKHARREAREAVREWNKLDNRLRVIISAIHNKTLRKFIILKMGLYGLFIPAGWDPDDEKWQAKRGKKVSPPTKFVQEVIRHSYTSLKKGIRIDKKRINRRTAYDYQKTLEAEQIIRGLATSMRAEIQAYHTFYQLEAMKTKGVVKNE